MAVEDLDARRRERLALASSMPSERLEKRRRGPHPPDMDDTWRTKVDDRLLGLEKGLLELKGDVSGLKIAIGALISATAIGFAVLGGFTYFMAGSLNARMDRVEAKVDALGPRIADEFRVLRQEMAADSRAMRTEMAAQTSAVANSITATKQQAPQVILVPAPEVQRLPRAPQQ